MTRLYLSLRTQDRRSSVHLLLVHDPSQVRGHSYVGESICGCDPISGWHVWTEHPDDGETPLCKRCLHAERSRCELPPSASVR